MNEDVSRSSVGKIGRMPIDLRREICKRIANNEPAASIISWVKTEPRALAVLDEQFAGADLLPQNISEWKKSSEYSDYLEQQKEIERTRALSSFALDLAKGSEGTSAGSVAVLGGKILSMLESADPATASALVNQVVKLRRVEQKDADLKLKRKSADQRDRSLALAENQFEVRTCEIFVKWYDDRKVAEVMAKKDTTRPARIDALRKVLFGDKPKDVEIE